MQLGSEQIVALKVQSVAWGGKSL